MSVASFREEYERMAALTALAGTHWLLSGGSSDLIGWEAANEAANDLVELVHRHLTHGHPMRIEAVDVRFQECDGWNIRMRATHEERVINLSDFLNAVLGRRIVDA